MRIVWLNEAMTEAIVYRGIVRRRQASLKRGTKQLFNDDGYAYAQPTWLFSLTDREVSWYVGWRLETRRNRETERAKIRSEAERVRNKEWVPVASVPQAKVIGFLNGNTKEPK